jgi:hypothetical protein
MRSIQSLAHKLLSLPRVFLCKVPDIETSEILTPINPYHVFLGGLTSYLDPSGNCHNCLPSRHDHREHGFHLEEIPSATKTD